MKLEDFFYAVKNNKIIKELNLDMSLQNNKICINVLDQEQVVFDICENIMYINEENYLFEIDAKAKTISIIKIYNNLK